MRFLLFFLPLSLCASVQIDFGEVPFAIEVPIEKLVFHKEGEVVMVRGEVGRVPVDWIFACGNTERLRLTREERACGVVNLVEHFAELLPSSSSPIGLVTAQNGMAHGLQEFCTMGEAILRHFPEAPLFLGLHNPGDAYMVGCELVGLDTLMVEVNRYVFGELAKKIDAIHPDLQWLHIQHSEGTLLFYLAAQGMSAFEKQLLQTHLLLLSFSPVRPIPRQMAKRAINIYSEGDYLTKWGARKYLEDPDYEFSFVPPLSDWKEHSLFFADHHFLGPTYQQALSDHLADLR